MRGYKDGGLDEIRKVGTISLWFFEKVHGGTWGVRVGYVC